MATPSNRPKVLLRGGPLDSHGFWADEWDEAVADRLDFAKRTGNHDPRLDYTLTDHYEPVPNQRELGEFRIAVHQPKGRR